jgi:selenocysteine lyase/cysteine desulfurase
VDILACGGQKWLMSPWGTGFVYVREPLVRQIEPAVIGWMAVKGSEDFTHLTDYDFTLRDDARRFEVNTLAAQDYAAMAASISLLLDLGPANAARHIESLLDAAIAWIDARDDITLVTPRDPAHRAGILSFIPQDPAAAAQRLRRAKVWHSLRESAIRLSPHCYNSCDEVLRALAIATGS